MNAASLRAGVIRTYGGKRSRPSSFAGFASVLVAAGRALLSVDLVSLSSK